MNIGIVTVYESIDNFGSYLQTYAMKKYLEQQGNRVYVIQNQPVSKLIKKYVCKINPKRECLHRIKKGFLFLADNRRLNIVDKTNVDLAHLDLIIYGSDEIWNLENPYFRNSFFWGGFYPDTPKIAYAVSIGAMTCETEEEYVSLFADLLHFQRIMVRDERTYDFVSRRISKDSPIVCDPTMLLPIESLSEPIHVPKQPYLFVYTYGVDIHIAELIKQYAKRHGLIIISACFWHPWADKTIECSPLQLSSLLKAADCVFTSTFHGALFTMFNHKRCCIYPTREKVKNIVVKLGMEDRLIKEKCSYEQFENTMKSEFQANLFEDKLQKWRDYSKAELEESFQCLTRQ